MSEYRNQIVFSSGRKGSGKSKLLWDMFTSRHPKVLTIGHIPEDLARDPDVVKARGRAQLYRMIEQVSGFDRWHLAAALDPDAIAELCSLLAPPYEAAPESSLSVALGGVALECCEAYELAPSTGTPPEVLGMWRRGRHYQLDLFMASQRPYSVAREVTAQADLIFAFAQGEKRDIDFLADTVSKPFAQAVARLRIEEYRCMVYNRADQTSRLLDRDRRTVGRPAAAGPLDQVADE